MPSYLSISGATMISGSIVPVLVTPPTPANPEDLIYTLGGSGLTTTGVSGTIFAVGGVNNIIQDDVVPPNWYHGAYSPIVLPAPTYFSEDVAISNSEIDVISSEQTRGLFEEVIGSSVNINNVTNGTTTNITSASATTLQVGDRILVEGANIPDGIYLITAILGTSITIFYDSTSDPAYVSGGTIKKHIYLWDEVFTTPMGLYSQVTVAPTPPALNLEFAIIGSDSNLIDIVITDPNIVPKINDYLVIQKIHLDTINPTTLLLSTTDGVNNIINVPSAETYTFKITNVTNNAEVYSLTLDKSFTATVTTPADPKFMFILLNRKDNTYKNLYAHTWELHEVHRKQLLGDPYVYQGIALPDGRSNYLYYKGSEYLGVQNLLNNFLPVDKTPFILLHFNDNIKDRIYYSDNHFELHLPNVILQNEKTPTILTNNHTVLEDGYIGKYSPLTTKYHSLDITYGYVFFDLRVVVITHGEMAVAMGYNSNRNYSLPLPTLPETGNREAYSTRNNPLQITEIVPLSSSATVIKTSARHNLNNSESLVVNGITTYPGLNSPAGSNWYVKKYSGSGCDPDYCLELYSNIGLTIPVTQSGTPIINEGSCHSLNPLYWFFLTYRLTGDNYETTPCACEIPFNFRGPVGIDNLTGYVSVDIEFLTHLICANGNMEGFNAENIELIIGMYKPSVNDPLILEDYTFIKVLPGVSLFTGADQNSPHRFINIPINYVIASGVNFDLINNQPIYHGITIPDTLFTGEGEWLLGNVKYKEHAKQYRLTFDATIPADKWNGTQNPSFETGNLFMQNKFISEIAFTINRDTTGAPQVYAKMYPVIKKSNSSDVKIKVQLDF